MNYKLKYDEPLPHKDDDYLASILKKRGIGDVETYLNPTRNLQLDPQLLNNMEIGVELLYKHLKNNSKIFLQVDSDTDGYTSAAVLYNYIMRVKPDANVVYRFHEGKQHGVIVDTVPEDTTLVLLPDSSSNEYEKHEALSEMGIDVLVIDHHHADKESEFAVVINNQLSPLYDNKTLSGAGVVYKFCQFYDTKYGYNFADEDADLVAVGIVADMMDLRDFETRAIVEYGLNHICNEGLKALVTKSSFTLNNRSTLNPIDVAFTIAPFINAITRVGTLEAKETMFIAFIDGLRLLPSTKRGHKPGDLEYAGEKLFRLATNARNDQNKTIVTAMENFEGRIHEYDLLSNKILVLFAQERDDFDSNITGLIAMKLAAKYGKPTILVKLGEDGVYKGSARGLNDSAIDDLRQFFTDSGYFEFAEGHANAHGVGIRADKIDAFIEYSNKELKDVEFNENIYLVDYIFSADAPEITPFVLATGGADVWGVGVETPMFIVENIILHKNDIKLMKNNSMKFEHNGVTYVALNKAEFCEDFQEYETMQVDICGIGKINEWAGRINPQVTIKDYNIRDLQKVF